MFYIWVFTVKRKMVQSFIHSFKLFRNLVYSPSFQNQHEAILRNVLFSKQWKLVPNLLQSIFLVSCRRNTCWFGMTWEWATLFGSTTIPLTPDLLYLWIRNQLAYKLTSWLNVTTIKFTTESLFCVFFYNKPYTAVEPFTQCENIVS